MKDLGPIPIKQATSNTYAWQTRVQICERPGTHLNQSGTPKYPQFDYLLVPLGQMVQELEHINVSG